MNLMIFNASSLENREVISELMKRGYNCFDTSKMFTFLKGDLRNKQIRKTLQSLKNVLIFADSSFLTNEFNPAFLKVLIIEFEKDVTPTLYSNWNWDFVINAPSELSDTRARRAVVNNVVLEVEQFSCGVDQEAS